MKKVLIIYGTRWGSTEEISQKLANILNEEGIEAELLNLETTKKRDYPSLDGYDGILLGSGIKIKRWTKSARKFLKKYADELKEKPNALGVFVSCGDGGIPEKREQAKEEYIKSMLDKYEVEADIYEAMGGMIDLTEDSKMGKFSIKMMNMAAQDDPDLKANDKNDTRDWDRIKEFGKNFCALLNT
jgi:menaquinone-dependent protoporphyrinogen oxidase